MSRLEDRYHSIDQYAKTACFACGASHPYLVSCTRCRRVSYCNSVCQKIDFATHKHICKAWADTRDSYPISNYPLLEADPLDEHELRDVMSSMSLDMMGPLMVRLGEKIGKIANFLVLYEPRCARCLPVNGAGQIKLEACPDCVYRWCADTKCRAACKYKHKESGMCDKLQRITKDEQFLRLHESERKAVDPPLPLWCPPRVLRVDTPLPSDWQAYASSVQAPHRNAKHGEAERAFFQHSLSIPLTIVAALERFGLRAKYTDGTDKKDLTIHLLGAEVEFELLSVGFVYEEITHLLPGVKRLRVVFVGPSLAVPNESVQEQQCCPVCQEDERSRVFECRKSTYHDFVREHKPSLPDLAVAFNSGMHEEPQKWSSTLSVLLANRTPTVLTSFNAHEAAEDARVVSRKAGAGVEWVWKEEENKWKSGRDHFDVTSPSGFWSENQYWMGWRGV